MGVVRGELPPNKTFVLVSLCGAFGTLLGISTPGKLKYVLTHEIFLQTANATSTPSYSLDLHISVFPYRPDRGALMFKNMFLKFKNIQKWCMLNKKRSTMMLYYLFLDKPGSIPVQPNFWTYCMLPIVCFFISDRYCHNRSDNCIIIPRKCMSKEEEGVLLAFALQIPLESQAVLYWSCSLKNVKIFLSKLFTRCEKRNGCFAML